MKKMYQTYWKPFSSEIWKVYINLRPKFMKPTVNFLNNLWVLHGTTDTILQMLQKHSTTDLLYCVYLSYCKSCKCNFCQIFTVVFVNLGLGNMSKQSMVVTVLIFKKRNGTITNIDI